MNLKKFIVSAFALAAFVMSAPTASAAYTHVSTLKMGMTSSQVVSLQQTLNMTTCKVATVGAGSSGMETMYFGGLTKAAVMCFQASNGLVADGIVGPMTGAKLVVVSNGSVSGNFPAGCTSAAGYSPTTGQPCNAIPSNPGNTGGLNGTDGTISDVNELGSYSGEEVGEGQSDVKVAGFEVEASNDGDIQLTSAKVAFTITNASGSNNLDDYVSEVTIWQGSTKVGSAEAEDFDEGSAGVWSKTVSLSGAIVRADDAENFYITVDGAGSFDSGDIDSEVVTVDVDNLRFKDGSGVTTTETGYDLDGMDVSIAFVSFSAAADTELKISTDDTPVSSVIAVDDSENTDGVLMLKGELEVEGDSDVWLDELPVTLTATGDSPLATTANVTLIIDGETFNETVSTSNASTATITFDNLDLDIEAGDTIKFQVKADINDIEDSGAAATDFDAGDQLTISVTTTNRASIVAENEEGDSLTDGTEITGSATGNAMIFRTEGVNVDMGTPTYSRTEDTNGNITSVTYTIPVSVTSFGDTLFMGQSAQLATAATASNAFALVLETAAAPTTESTSATTSITLSSSDAQIEGNGYRLDDGETKHFTVTVHMTAATDNQSIRFRLDTVRTFTNSGLSGDTASNSDLLPTTEFRTGFQYINN